MTKQLKTVCNRDCPDACSIVATVENGRVTRLAGDPEHPVTRGALCYRTSRFLDRQYSTERLTSPLVREGDGLREIGWDEALDLAARRLVDIRRQSGPAAIFHYRSGGSLGMLKCLTDLFFERFGPVTVKRGDICSGAGDAAQMTDFGEEDSHDLFDLLNSRNIILWGKNAYISSPHTVPILRGAKARGARLALVDPVRQKTAHLCEAYWQPRPGGDLALAMAVARVLFEQGWVDPEAGTYCDHLEEFRQIAFSRSLEVWCGEADCAEDAAVDLARRLGPEKPAAILVGWGMGRRSNGGAIVRALDALAAISGNLGIPGGGVSFYFKRRGAFDMSFVTGAAARTVCEPLFGPEVLAASEPLVRAVWVTAGNPVAMLPESGTIERALRSREFVVVVDSFLTDTARCAHLVLPTSTLLEDDDLLGSYGHHWIGASRPVVERPEGVRSDLEIMQGLAERVGLGDVMAGSARDWKRRMVGPKLGAVGVTLEQLEAGPMRSPLAPRVLFEGRKFATRTGRVNLMHEAPGTMERAPEGFPLQLLALSTEKAQSSQRARSVEGPLEVTVHPDAAGGVADGAEARLESRIGWIPVRVKHDAGQRRDVVLTAKGGHLRDGRCSNALVRARLTDIGEGGAIYEEFVRIVAAD